MDEKAALYAFADGCIGDCEEGGRIVQLESHYCPQSGEGLLGIDLSDPQRRRARVSRDAAMIGFISSVENTRQRRREYHFLQIFRSTPAEV